MSVPSKGVNLARGSGLKGSKEGGPLGFPDEHVFWIASQKDSHFWQFFDPVGPDVS